MVQWEVFVAFWLQQRGKGYASFSSLLCGAEQYPPITDPLFKRSLHKKPSNTQHVARFTYQTLPTKWNSA
jgi:hypothetical protein